MSHATLAALVARSADRVRRDTAGHRMSVRRNDGLYRHVRFENDRNEISHFNLITYPNGLLIRGDGPNFVFSTYSTIDPFNLFRRSSHSGISPDYWAQRVVAGQVMAWSEGKFRTWVSAIAADAEASFPGATEAVRDQILDSDEHTTEYEESARYAVSCFNHDGLRISFPEPWERIFEEYDRWYLWALHAIAWGIGQYDAARSAAETAGVPA